MAGRAVKAWTKLVEMGLPVVTSVFPAIMSGQSVEGGLRGASKGYEGWWLAANWHCDLFMASRPLLLPSDMGWSVLDGNTHGTNVDNIKHTFYAGKKTQVRLLLSNLQSILT